MATATVDINNYYSDEANFDNLKEAASRLLNASEKQFEEIKKEKWFNRVFDLVTFSQKEKKRTADQITTLSQAQQILMEILTILSDSDNKVADLAMENLENIKRLIQNDTYLMKRLIRLENNALGIKKNTDPQNLSQKNQSVLSGCLYHMKDLYCEISSLQKNYVNTLLDYIDNNGDTVENLDYALSTIEESDRKTILICCMEFIFLNSCNMEISNDLQDFIDYFNLGNKTIRETKKYIEDTYNLRGADGIIGKYTSFVSNEENNYFDIDLEEDINGSNTSVPLDSEVPPQEMTDYYISSILQVQAEETKIFSYKIIHINTYIQCNGKLEFNNCIIYYNESESANGISLEDGSSISFKNCSIICLEYDKTDAHFITSRSVNSVQIIFENCSFENCFNLIKASSLKKFKMNDCNILNCYGEFIEVYLSTSAACSITGCSIIENKSPKYNLESSYYPNTLFDIQCYDGFCEISNNTIVENLESNDRAVSFSYFKSTRLAINNCTFVGASNCLINFSNIKDCQFKDCKKVVSLGLHIDSCYFEHCTNVLTLLDNSKVSHCQFVDCYNEIITPASLAGGILVEYCEFFNLQFEKSSNDFNFRDNASIVLRVCKGKEGRSNKIYKCIFNGAQMNTGFLIAAKGYEKPNRTVAYIEECSFLNCTTKRESGSIVKTKFYYDTLFKKEIELIAIEIKNCKGLDKINKESYEEPIIKKAFKNTSGLDIGSALAINAGSLSIPNLVAIVGGSVLAHTVGKVIVSALPNNPDQDKE